MDAENALFLIRSLADGVDPITNEELVADNPVQHPRLVRALMSAVGALERDLLRLRRQERLPSNAGAPWSEEEDSRLARGVDDGATVRDLARRHERTATAIRVRLEKLGKVATQ